MNFQLSQIIDTLREEKEAHTNGARPKGRCCKYCNTFLAVVMDEPTIVHERDPLSQSVAVKCYYHGKAKCNMCHRYQV
jgi:hypothetical protein